MRDSIDLVNKLIKKNKAIKSISLVDDLILDGLFRSFGWTVGKSVSAVLQKYDCWSVTLISLLQMQKEIVVLQCIYLILKIYVFGHHLQTHH